MVEPQLDTHPDISVRIEHVGDERTPLIIVDNLIDKPQELVEYAAEVGLAPPTDMYPGLRAAAPKSYFDALRKGLSQAINQAYDLGDMEMRSALSYMCVVTTKPKDLKPVQAMPHIDGIGRNSYSSVHYLCSPDYQGTSLYRHCRTGYEVVSDFRHDRFRTELEEELREKPWRTQAYINGDTAMFQKVYSAKVAFNRAVLYPASALHSADIGADFKFDPDPRTGRFSVNSRIEMRPREAKKKPWFTAGR